MIKDVSKQYAAILNESAIEDEKYSKACREACQEIDDLKEREIAEFDEEEISPYECGFSEEEVQVDEVIDPMKIYQDAKAREEQRKQQLVKVDNNYINMMKKLLACIRTSKKDVYERICGQDGKLREYMKSGTMLPPPADFAENFVSFEQISKALSGKDDGNSDSEDAGDDVGDEDMSLGSRAAKEYADTDNTFGNQDAEENLWDISEEELNAMGYSKDNVNEADYREPISHALDPIGVKASTASLAGQDATAISVVEKLLSKIDKLESKIDVLESRAEKNFADATPSKSVNEEEDLDAEEDDEIVLKKSDVEKSQRKFESDLDKLSKPELEKVLDQMADRIQKSVRIQREIGADPSVQHDQQEVRAAVKKIEYLRELSYERELTPEEKKEFSDLVYEYWYDWIYVDKTDEDGEAYSEPEKSVRDILNEPFKSFFARPGNHVPFEQEFRIYDDGKEYVLANFQYTRDPYEELKSTKARRGRESAKDIQAKIDAGKGFKPKRGTEGAWIANNPDEPLRKPEAGEKGTWTINDWNHMMGTLSSDRRKQIEQELRAEIERENPNDQVKRAKELAFLKMLFNRAKGAAAANSDYVLKLQKEHNRKKRLLNSLTRELNSQLSEISQRIKDLEQKQKELKKRLAADPDDDDADSELVDVNWDLEEALRDYDDKEDEIRDIAEDIDEYLKTYKPSSNAVDSDEDDEEVEDDIRQQTADIERKTDGKIKAQDLRKLSGIATDDLAPTMLDRSGKPYEVHAYRNFEKRTVEYILQALSDITGKKDNLFSALTEMPEPQFRRFLYKVREISQKKDKSYRDSLKRAAGEMPVKVHKARPAKLF